MSEQARTPGVSPAEEAIQEAWNRVIAWRLGGDLHGEPSLHAILADLACAAQVEALESVAKDLKAMADAADTEVQRARVDRDAPNWRLNQDAGAAQALHEAWGVVQSALSRLRQSASAPKER